MVKVAENRVVDIDVLPGTKNEDVKAQVDQATYFPPLPLSLLTYQILIPFPNPSPEAKSKAQQQTTSPPKSATRLKVQRAAQAE
ncbi:MAG: hypothetical protein Q9164_006953, partial [Protoblastenia rupestris]